MKTEDFSKVTPQIFALSQYCMRCDQIDPNLYTKTMLSVACVTLTEKALLLVLPKYLRFVHLA